MSFDFTSPDSDKAARVATGAVGSIQDHLRKPTRSVWVGLGVWLMLNITVIIFTVMFAYVGGRVGWNVEQFTGLVGFGLGITGLVIVWIVFDGYMVLACIGWNMLATIILGILASG
jgi:hypothetical protein